MTEAHLATATTSRLDIVRLHALEGDLVEDRNGKPCEGAATGAVLAQDAARTWNG